MKSTQAWGWLAAGVMALGLNGFYHDGGAAWAHRAVDQGMAGVSERTEGVVALAAGRADWFVAKAQTVAARDETASCRLAEAVAPKHDKKGRGAGMRWRGAAGGGRGPEPRKGPRGGGAEGRVLKNWRLGKGLLGRFFSLDSSH